MRSLQIVVRQGFKTRLFQAHAALEGREGARIGREEIGKRVGKALSTDPIPQSTVASWFGEILPPADIGAGLAAVYDVRAGWLYFGEGEAQPAEIHDDRAIEQRRRSKAQPHQTKKPERGSGS